MGKIILVTGGARSGKSTFAEKKAASLGERILYIATAVPFDDEMKDRIRKHQAQRPATWDTAEAYKDMGIQIPKHYKNHHGILLDCVTVMVTNLMFDNPNINWDQCPMEVVNDVEANIKSQFDQLIRVSKKVDADIILVTNELGMGIVPENRLARIFRDIAGRINQQLAESADEVYLVVSGIPLQIK